MTTISISTLKTSPAKALAAAQDYPVAVAKRSKVKAYLLGEHLYEKLLSYVEDYIDQRAVKSANFRRGRDFDKVVKQLGL